MYQFWSGFANKLICTKQKKNVSVFGAFWISELLIKDCGVVQEDYLPVHFKLFL